MNEITRIHIAKTAYDIEIAAKKQLEKYIKSLETYTKDAEVVQDIEIRITELLAERGVAAGGVIGVDDVAAVRKQLGEPHEFVDGEGDIAVGPDAVEKGRRLYRSTDNAVLGGVLSGIAAYFNVNPLWTRLVFILLMFISFGTAMFVYILFWILIAPARTATEKLQLAGKEVTVESIKALNADEEKATPNRTAPVLQKILSVIFGSLAALASLGVLITTVWMSIAAVTFQGYIVERMNGFMGLGGENVWLVWLLFWITIFGLLLLSALFAIVAYAFFAKKLTKKMLISGAVIIVLGIASAATVIGVSATQSMRIANETRSLVQETKANLPSQFKTVNDVTFETKRKNINETTQLFPAYVSIRYVVDEGPARYELTALPTAKVAITTEGETAKVSIDIPESYRNSFVQPVLTIYGPALKTITTNSMQVQYEGVEQDSLTVKSVRGTNTQVNGTFNAVTVSGRGGVDLGSSSIQQLTVNAEQNLSLSAGAVRELTVTQPDVCPSNGYNQDTSVVVRDVTSGKMTYNGKQMDAVTHETTCAVVTVQTDEEREEYR